MADQSTINYNNTNISPAKSPASLPASHPAKSPSLSPSKNSAKSFLALCKEAEYIQRQTDKWEDDNNPIVKVAQTMSTQIQHMTQYIRQKPPITSHLGLVQTGKAMAENSQKVLKFAHIIMEHCVDESFCADLRSYCNQVPLVTKQLLILANVQLGTAQNDTADRILVQNAQNLMKKILQMMSACEAVCIKGLSSTLSDDSESAVLLAIQWRKKYIQHRQRGINDMNIDELGLRIVEDETIPPALKQIFKPVQTS